MKNRIKKLFKNNLFLSFFYSLCLGILIIVPNIIYGKGIYNLLADFSFQEIPFNIMINESIKEGSILWTWFNELGSNFIGTFSFYNLFSPFNIIGYLFPASWFPYLIGLIYILKYAVAGLTSFLFLKRYVKNEKYALVGSLLYTFSGFQLTNILFYHFHDVVAFFPLLLYTIDNYMYDNKKGWFGLTVTLLAFTNWFFFIGQGVFLIIYFITKLVCKEYKFDIKRILYLVFEGLCGISIATVVLLPTAIFTISNPRVTADSNIINLLKYPISNYIEILKAFILPAQSMSARVFLTESNFTSTEAYLPVVGILLSLGCLLKYPKKWFSVLIIICGIFMLVPVLNSSFFMFVSVYYARWFYMPILILALMSIKCLEDKCNLKKPLIINIVLFVLLFLGIIVYMIRIDSTQIIYDKTYFIIMLIFTVLSLIVTYLLCKNMTIKKLKILLMLIFIFVFIWGNYMTYSYKTPSLYKDNNYGSFLYNNKELAFENERVISDETCYFNMGYIGRYNNLKTFNSNLNGSNFEFYESIDYQRNVNTNLMARTGENDYLFDFLGIKYIISRSKSPINNYKLVKETKNYYIFFNEDYLNFGFNTNNYISTETFSKLDFKEKQKVLTTSIVLNKEQIEKYKKLYNKKVTYKNNEFKFIKNGFESKIESTGETLAIYQIPYDSGWKATNNGKAVLIEKVDNGMMAIKVNEGINSIKFTYFPPGLKGGIAISLIGLTIYILYFYFNVIKKA